MPKNSKCGYCNETKLHKLYIRTYNPQLWVDVGILLCLNCRMVQSGDSKVRYLEGKPRQKGKIYGYVKVELSKEQEEKIREKRRQEVREVMGYDHDE